LTTNSLVFDKKKMHEWWKRGYNYAEQQSNAVQKEKIEYND